MTFFLEYCILFLKIIQFCIFLRIILSFFPQFQGGRFYGFVFEVTHPLLQFIKQFPHKWKLFDFSPLIALFAIDILIFFLSSYL